MTYTNIGQGTNTPFVVRYLSDLLTYRHLMWNLVGSDLRARFRRSYFGILWAVFQPFAFSVVLGIVWGRMLNVASVWDLAAYIFAGMIVWEYFSNVILISQDALIGSEGYLRQARIPFIIFQVRQSFTGIVIFGAGFVGFIIFLTILGRLPPIGLHSLLFFPYLCLLLGFAVPISIIMSILGAKFRDLKHISSVAVSALFFISPVMLQRNVLDSESLHLIKYVNPIVPLLDLFREPMMYGHLWPRHEVLVFCCWIGALWLIAIFLSVKEGRRIIYHL